jgi:hypothetical protein
VRPLRDCACGGHRIGVADPAGAKPPSFWVRRRRLIVKLARPTMRPPGRFEILLFWTAGIVITILSGGVAIYASYFHLWN